MSSYKTSLDHVKNDAYRLIRFNQSEQLRDLAQELSCLQQKILSELQLIKERGWDSNERQ